MAKPGDKVSITTKDETLQGTLMPDDGIYTVLKLDNGYNIGIAKKKVKDIKVVEAYKAHKEEESSHTHTPGLPLITILHTGGTFASKVDYETGGTTPRFSPAELLSMFPELRSIANIESRLVRNMWSEDIRFAHYNILAKEIEKEIAKGVRGIIITHGTDTLHYTAAALSFMVRSLPIPVILVGAQRSSDRGSSDAAMNLICAAHFITKTDFAGIALCMHESMSDTSCLVLPSMQTRKMHSTRRDAFKPINARPLARVSYDHGVVEWLRTSHPIRNENKPVITLMDEKLKIGILYAHPNMWADELKNYEQYDGLLILGTGVGNLSINEIDECTKENGKIYSALKELVKKGVVVVMGVQTIFGAVEHHIYSAGRDIEAAGVLGHGICITPETAFIKLAWLLSNHKDHLAIHWSENIAGELSGNQPDDYL